MIFLFLRTILKKKILWGIEGRLIKQKKITDKINKKEQLSEEDYRIIGNLLCSLASKKDNINYVFIFGLSAVAIITAVYMDFMRWGRVKYGC